jgi:hypothetical protein
MNVTINELSLKAHIRIRNQFTGFFNTPELTTWHLRVEHSNHRGDIFNFEGKDLDVLLNAAMDKMIEIDQNYEEKVSALGVLHPDKNKYEIANMARYYE